MIWVFWIYRALVALGLLAIALQLAVLGWRRPLEISESAPLLLTLAIVALALAVIALMRRRAASLALLAAAIATTLFLGMVVPLLALVPPLQNSRFSPRCVPVPAPPSRRLRATPVGTRFRRDERRDAYTAHGRPDPPSLAVPRTARGVGLAGSDMTRPAFAKTLQERLP